MHSIETTAHGLTVAIRHDGAHARECFVDEPLVVGAAHSPQRIELVEQPGGGAAAIDGMSATCRVPGLHVLNVHFADGQASTMRLVACERAALERIPTFPAHIIVNERADPKPVGRSLQEKYLVLRALANHAPTFDGTAESFDTVGSLANFGA